MPTDFYSYLKKSKLTEVAIFSLAIFEYLMANFNYFNKNKKSQIVDLKVQQNENMTVIDCINQT